MAKPKTPPAKKAPPEEPPDEGVADDESTITPMSLSAKERAFLRRVARFLVSIQSPTLVRRARRECYTAAEHKEGWRLWRIAAGEDRPLDHFLAEQEIIGGGDPGGMALLQQIDDFENTWFPRTRAIIRRVVPRDSRVAFAGAFFQDLAQQPLGPSVVGSVGTYLKRVDGLTTSKDPAAKKVRETLIKRGLTDQRIAQMRGLLDQFETLRDSDKAKPSREVTAEQIAAAQAAQLEAYELLRDWFNDWGTTLRKVFTAREQVQLGLAVLRRGRIEVAEDEDGADVEDEDGEEAEPAEAGEPTRG